MKKKLSQRDRDRVVASNRKLLISLLVTLAVIAVVLVVLIIAVPSIGGVAVFGMTALGLLIGFALVVPQRSLLRELGITTEEAKAIIAEEKQRPTRGA